MAKKKIVALSLEDKEKLIQAMAKYILRKIGESMVKKLTFRHDGAGSVILKMVM